MRLFDKVLLLKSDARAAWVAERVQWLTVIACDAIASYAERDANGDEGKLWKDDDFPCCRSPWNISFLEWNLPEGHPKPGFVDEASRQFVPQQVGWFVQTATDEKAKELLFKWCSAGRFVGGGDLSKWNSSYEVSLAWEFVCHRGSAMSTGTGAVWLVAEDGSVIDRIFFTDDHIASEEAKASIAWTAQHQVAICLLTMAFANCCNVKLEDVTDDLQPEPKIRRRLKLPEVKRYTLNIAGHVARPSRDYNEGPQGVMPFHLCRGHFATYTADKPMFGNPKLVGRYWHPPHMKGKKENGEIIKDYAIAQ